VKLSWRGANRLFLGTAVVQSAAEGHLTAFNPLLLQDLGLSDAEVAVWSGLLFAMMMTTAFSLAPFWAVLAERFSSRPIILRSFFFLSAALMLAAWAPNLVWLSISRLLVGLCFGTGGVILAAQAMITPRNRLGSVIAMLQSSNPIGVSIGPPIGALLIPIVGLRGLFVLDAVVVLIAGLTLATFMPDLPPGRKTGSMLGRTRQVLGMVWAIPPVRWNYISAFTLRGAVAVVDTYLPVRITQISSDPATAIGWILGVYGAVTTAATYLVGRIIDRANETILFWRAMLFGAIVTLGIAFAPSVWLLAVLAVLRAIPSSMGNILLHTNIARNVPREQQMVIFSLAPVPRNSGALTLPLVAAVIVSLAPGSALLVGAAAYGLASLGGLKIAAETRKYATHDATRR
jgi:predicted MFS family arabinose efflux permease